MTLEVQSFFAAPSSLTGGGLNWQVPVVTEAGTTAVAGTGYRVNTQLGGFSMKLPSNPNVGDSVAFLDYDGNFADNNFIIAQSDNSENIMGVNEDLEMTFKNQVLRLVYSGDSGAGWRVEHGTHTGGTVAFSGDGITEAPSSPTHSIDFTGNNLVYRTTLTEDTSIVEAAVKAGVATSFYIVLTQNGAGGHIVTLPTTWKSQGGIVTLDPNSISVLHGLYDGTNYYVTITNS